jgi:L-amino acid N-acyltransferase YncA
VKVRRAPRLHSPCLTNPQGHGIGTLLLKHLARIAQMKGINEFAADVLSTNKQMLEVFANSGFRVNDSYESGVVRGWKSGCRKRRSS